MLTRDYSLFIINITIFKNILVINRKLYNNLYYKVFIKGVYNLEGNQEILKILKLKQ